MEQTLKELLVTKGLAKSYAEVRTMCSMGTISINGETKNNPEELISCKEGDTIQRGKRLKVVV